MKWHVVARLGGNEGDKLPRSHRTDGGLAEEARNQTSVTLDGLGLTRMGTAALGLAYRRFALVDQKPRWLCPGARPVTSVSQGLAPVSSSVHA